MAHEMPTREGCPKVFHHAASYLIYGCFAPTTWKVGIKWNRGIAKCPFRSRPRNDFIWILQLQNAAISEWDITNRIYGSLFLSAHRSSLTSFALPERCVFFRPPHTFVEKTNRSTAPSGTWFRLARDPRAFAPLRVSNEALPGYGPLRCRNQF